MQGEESKNTYEWLQIISKLIKADEIVTEKMIPKNTFTDIIRPKTPFNTILKSGSPKSVKADHSPNEGGPDISKFGIKPIGGAPGFPF